MDDKLILLPSEDTDADETVEELTEPVDSNNVSTESDELATETGEDSPPQTTRTDVPLVAIEPEPVAGDLPHDALPADMSAAEKSALLVGLLFTSGERVETARLAEFLQLEPSELLAMAEEAAGSLRRLGLDILPAAGGIKLVSSAELDPYIAEFHRDVRKTRLSRSALEVLAIVAYEQPVNRSQIDDIRAVNSESTVRALLDRRLIAVAGRAETPGRPFLYRTTDAFLEVFGLGTLDDLPPRPATLRSSTAAEEGDLGPFSSESEDE